MLEFLQLRAQNMGSYRELDAPLHNQGVTLVTGENRDEPRTPSGIRASNGSGKSTLFEILTHGLFQTSSKPTFVKNGALNAYHPRDAWIEVIFKNFGHIYTVRQYRNHKVHGTSLKLFEDSTDISATGTKAIIQTQAILEQKLGLTLGEWFGFVYLAQKHTHAMVDGRPAEKKEYLSRVFGLDVIDNHDKNLKVYMSDLSEAKSKSDALLEREVELKKLLRTVPTQSSTSLDLVVDDLRKQLVNAKVELSKSKQSRKRKVVAERLHKLGILQGTESYGPNTSSTLEKLRLSVKSELAEAQKNYELQKQIDKLKSKIPDDPLDEAKLKHKLDGIHKQLSELRAFAKGVSQLRELDNQLTLLKSTQDKAGKYDSDKAAEYEKSLKKLEDKISVLKASVSALEKFQAGGDTCPSCLQTVPESHVKQIKTTLATSKSELVTLTKDHKKIKELIEDLEELQELKGKISNCRNKRQEALDNIPFDVTPDKIPTDAELSKTIESFELKAESLQAKVILASKQAEWKKELDSAPKVKSINLDDIATLEKKLEALTDAKAFSWERSNDNFKSVKKECRELSRRYRKAVKRQLRIKTAASERERIQTEIHELKKQLSSLQKQTDSYNLASTIRLGLKDLKLVRLREATGILTDILPAYVAALFPGKNIKVKVDKRKGDSFDLLVEKGGKIIPLHSLSGGQGKKLGIAVVLAFTQLTSKRTNLLIADEPYSALDAPSRQICDDLIRETKVPSIFLTTHDRELLSRRYEQIWRCVMRNNTTTLHRKVTTVKG